MNSQFFRFNCTDLINCSNISYIYQWPYVQGEPGLYHRFTLRNIIDGQGIEIMYELYNPMIRDITVLKLEKRLDDELFYLRDALPEYRCQSNVAK